MSTTGDTVRTALAGGVFALALSGAAVSADDEAAGWIAYNKDLLRQRLVAPDSARFREVFFSRKAGVPVVCGEVDSKDATDAYTGYERFVGAGSVGVFFRWDVNDFEALWRHFCR